MRSGRKEAAELIGTFGRGVRIVGVTGGQFSLIDLIEAVLEQVAPADVLVSTWTPGKAEMERVCELLETGMISRFRLLVDRSFPSRHPEYVARVSEILADGAEIRMTKTHAKFALVAAGDWRICVRTSMNFNVNPRLEQFDLDDDPRIYELFDRVARDLFEAVPEGLVVAPEDVSRGFRRASGRR